MVRLKRKMLDDLSMRMIEFNENDPARIQHLLKVHSFAKLIGELEGFDRDYMSILEAAALTHDIGIRPAEEKYGSCSGKYQEELGPAYAEEMLKSVGFHAGVIERVSYLVGHHHTYTNVDGLDYRILLEADFLVNLYEQNAEKDVVQEALENIFKTESGIKICTKMFGL
ncbi:MAG: HD domain-containing protein [Eubacteriales bacterium]